jgi:hypothetical protein
MVHDFFYRRAIPDQLLFFLPGIHNFQSVRIRLSKETGIQSVKTGLMVDIKGILAVEGGPAQTQVMEGIQQIGFSTTVFSGDGMDSSLKPEPCGGVTFETGEL